MKKEIYKLLKIFTSLFRKIFFENKIQIFILILYLIIFSVYLNYLNISICIIFIENILIFYLLLKKVLKVVNERFLKDEFFINELKPLKAKLNGLVIANIFLNTFGNNNLESLFTKNWYKILSVANLKFFLIGIILNFLIIFILSLILKNKYLNIIYEENKIRSCFKIDIFPTQRDYDDFIKKIKIENPKSNLEIISMFVLTMVNFSKFNKKQINLIAPYFFSALEILGINKEKIEEVSNFFINMGFLIADKDELEKIFQLLKENKFPQKIISEINLNYEYFLSLNQYQKFFYLNYNFFKQFISDSNLEKILIELNAIKKQTNKEKKILLKKILEIYVDLQLNKNKSICLEKNLGDYYNYFFCYKLITLISNYRCLISNLNYDLDEFTRNRYKEYFIANEEKIDKEIREVLYKL